MNSIEKFKLEEKIRIAFLRHRGDLTEMQKDTGLDLELLRKMKYKLQRKGGFGDSIITAPTIANYILEGVESRIYHHMEMLRGLNKKEHALMSVCCKMPVKHESVAGEVKYYCIKCKKETDVVEVTDATVIEAKRNLLADIREENRLLTEFVINMRNKNASEDVTKIILDFLSGLPVPKAPAPLKEREPEKGFVITDQNRDTVNKISMLPMPEKLKLLKELEKRIVDGKAVTDQALKENEEVKP